MSVTFNKAQMTFLQKQFDTMSVDMVGKMLGSEDGYDEDEAMELASSIFTTKGFKMTKTTKSTKTLKNSSNDEDDEDTAKVSKAKSRTKKTVKVKDPNRPKRAKTAFIIWSSSPEGVKQIKAENPELKHTEAVSEAGKVWKQMKEDEETGKYDKLAIKDKERYLQEMEVYNA